MVLLHVRLRPPPEHDGAAAAPADPEAGRTEEVAAWRREWALPQRRDEALGFLALRGDETLARARELIELGAEAGPPPQTTLPMAPMACTVRVTPESPRGAR